MLTPPTETPLLGPTRNDARATSAGARAHARTNDTKRYTFKTLIGSGGLGDVWLAYDHRLGRDVAVKLSALEHRPETLARFAAEAHIQSSLDHRGIVPVLDVGTDPSGRPYIAMALIEGESLERVRVRCARDAAYALRWPRARMLRVFVDLCGALDHAHTRGVVHCDIKPANVVVSHDGEVFVIDWASRAASTNAIGDRTKARSSAAPASWRPNSSAVARASPRARTCTPWGARSTSC
jgi:serine/threonine protein kinase